MGFSKMQKPLYPPRHWALVSFPGDGKSTFATQMRAPILPIDADHRFGEVINLVEGDVYELSANPADNMDPEEVNRLLNENMPGSGTKTIVVDSLTAIITPKVVQAVMDNDAGRNKNRMAGFKDKALSMRLLQDAITRWGTDTLWIYHLQKGRDAQAEEITRPTLPATERARLYRSINMELHIVRAADPSTRPGQAQRRGVKVVWARQGRSGMTLWDDSGKWAGMPEKIEAAVYGGLSQAEMKQIEQTAPAIFPTTEAAIKYGLAQGAFKALQHAKHAYEKFKRKHAGAAPEQIGLLWAEEVERRVEEKTAIEAVASGHEPDSPAAGESPSFATLEDLLFQLHVEFKLKETEAKAKLKELGFTGWPRNGGAKAKSTEMYMAVKMAMEKEKAEAEVIQDEIEF
jgi:hypothetical protein